MVTLTNVPKKGPSFDFYDRITVTASAFSTQPNMIIPFSTQGCIIVDENTSAIVEVSFNGTDVHERIDPSIFKSVAYDNRVISLVWFRLASGSSAVVSLRAWGIR